MSKSWLLFFFAATAVYANENVGQVFEGTVTCEWNDNAYNESTASLIRSKFFRKSDGAEVIVGKEITVRAINSSGKLATVLKIKPLRPVDVQNYDCFLINDLGNLTKTAPLIARPIPRITVFSQTIKEGEPFTLDCTFASTTDYNVSNYMFVSGGNKLDLMKATPPAGVVLNSSIQAITIAAVRNDHRGVYSCDATNQLGMTRVEVRLRIKSPLAAVWPAIGIFIEVVVLVVVVLVYERRRASQKDSDSPAADEDDDRGNSNDKKNAGGSADVRQRAAKA